MYAVEPCCPCLPNLVAHTDGYKIVVGAYNTVVVTVECQMHTGGHAAFSGMVDVGTYKYCLIPRGM